MKLWKIGMNLQDRYFAPHWMLVYTKNPHLIYDMGLLTKVPEGRFFSFVYTISAFASPIKSFQSISSYLTSY